ncbi:MAG: hypothetical protein K9M75_08205 [Phycisphaerae bacterium]|nr:hypothetical protein [Phycisphaerae bacterium]
MIKFRCKHCSQKLGVDDKYAGRRVRCSKCKEPIQVPQPSTPAAQSAPVKVEPTPEMPAAPNPPQTDIFDGLEDFQDDEEARRMEAIQMARQDRTSRKAKAVKFSPKAAKEKGHSRSHSNGKSGSGMMSLADMVPPVLAFPLSLLTSLLAAGITTAIWVAASRSSETVLSFFAIILFVATALGLRLFMVNRTVLLGLLGLIISLAGLGAAKAAIANYSVRPYYVKTSNEEILVNMDKIIADSKAGGKGQTESVKPYARNGTYQVCVAMMSMIDDGDLDAVKARGWMIPMLKNTTAPTDYSILLGESTPMPKITESSDEKKEAVATAAGIAFDWDQEKLLLKNTKKYFPVLEKLITQADHQKILADPDKSFKFCLAQTFGLLDILWILVGMGLTFVILTFD